ncbi:MAG: insulinase family protein, partial [Deltaproteobacteria bacterium]|nr:insulinase family protein [Deltaproteobacteria bacterium]
MRVVVVVLSLLISSLAWGDPQLDVHILDNGLKAGIVNTGSSHVLIELRVGAGFIDEGPSETGVAHWLEHGVFRGTPRFPTKQLFEKELKRLGIQYNASTTFERTNFFFIAPKENLKAALELFAEMIGRPVLDPKAMKDELEPVKQEALRDQVNAQFDLFMASLSLHAKTPRMAQPMTGTVEQMDTQSGELPRKFHDRWYSSDNITVAVVGGVDDVDAARTLIDKVFGTFGKFITPPRGSFKDEIKIAKDYKMYKVKAEPGSRRLLNVAFPIEYNMQNWAAATLFADYLNREDSALSMLTDAGLAESAGVSVDTFQDVIYVRMIIDL